MVCGLVNPDNFVGGRIRLDPGRAREAIRPIAERLGRSVEAAAEAIIDVALANMYAEFSQAMARHGLDPRDFTLVAFGGAGPLVACFLAAEFHIPRVLVPLSPGTLCALGALSADVRNDYVKTLHLRLGHGADRGAPRRPTPSCGSGPRPGSSRRGRNVLDRRFLYSADMRYQHQAFEIELPIEPRWLTAGDFAPDPGGLPRLPRPAVRARRPQGAGGADQRAREGGGDDAQAQGLARWAAGRARRRPPATARSCPAASGTGRRSTTATRLLAGQTLPGPAIVEQDDTTVLVPRGFAGTVDAFGNITITASAGA